MSKVIFDFVGGDGEKNKRIEAAWRKEFEFLDEYGLTHIEWLITKGSAKTKARHRSVPDAREETAGSRH
mgnify:CR=1 FL=1